MAVTSWTQVPNYDEWGADTYWNCDDWMTWHKHLKEHFGSDRAKLIWNYAYAQGTFGAEHWDCRTMNSTFRDYARKEGLDTYASVGVPVIPQVLSLYGSGMDLVSGISNSVSQLAEFFGNNKVVKVAVYVTLFSAVGYIGFRGFVLYKSKFGKK